MAPKAYEMKVTSLVELVGQDETVDQNEYGDEVSVPISGSGEILQAVFYSTGGDILQVEGRLMIFDTEPDIDVGASVITAAEHATVVGFIDVVAADWNADANGAEAIVGNQPITFQEVTKLWLAWRLSSATSINSAAGDNEVLRVRLWYRREKGC